MNPCEMGFRCPHLVYNGEDGDCCIHPSTDPKDIPEGVEPPFTEDVICPLCDWDSDFGYLISLSKEYSPEEWREVLRRLSIHLDRPYQEGARWHRIREEAASTAWREYYENSLREVGE